MNSLKLKLCTMAATLAIVATTASAQVTLKASVPFSFTAGPDKVLAAGDYSIRNGGNVWYITSHETLHTNLAMSTAAAESRATDRAQLVFHCRSNGCSLYVIQMGGGVRGAQFSEPKRTKSDSEELARVVVVPASTSNSD
jgi:hypothetical protein